jgi:hypothetical protein
MTQGMTYSETVDFLASFSVGYVMLIAVCSIPPVGAWAAGLVVARWRRPFPRYVLWALGTGIVFVVVMSLSILWLRFR